MRPVVTLGLGVAFGLVLAEAAHADNVVAVLDGRPPGLTPAEEPRLDARAPAPADVDAIGVATDNDALSDRAYGRSTAIPLRSGAFDLSMRTAVEHGSMLSVAVGLGHGAELSADAGYGREVGRDVGIGLKLMFARHPKWAAAFDLSLHSVGLDNDEAVLVTADLKLTTCIVDCGAMLTFGIGVMREADGNGYDSPTVPFLELSAVFGTGYVRPLLEGLSFAGMANFGFAGFRLGGRHVGVDLGVGLGGALADDGSDGGLAMMVGVGVRP